MVLYQPSPNSPTNSKWQRIGGLGLTQCFACKRYSLWVGKQLAWPLPATSIAPAPAVDMPQIVKEDYEEAASISDKSPRAAAALLRLALEKLCRQLGKTGNINAMIGSLVQDGLPKRVQQALDIVRVVGNEAVHPGQIDLRDEPETAAKLFQLLNLIVERMITEERVIDELFQSLPPDKLAGIAARDKDRS